MRIQPAQLPQERRPKGFWFKTLNDFAESPETCIEIIPEGEYVDTRSLQTTVSGAIHRYKFNLSTKREKDRLYVIKKIRKDNV